MIYGNIKRGNNEFPLFCSILICKKQTIMPYITFVDIVNKLVAWGYMNPYYAMLDNKYLTKCVNAYLESIPVVQEMMKFK